MDAFWPAIIMRLLHLGGAACILLGFLALPLLANAVIQPLGLAQGRQILQTIHRRATRLAWLGVLFQFISGTWSWILLSDRYAHIGVWADVVLGTKLLLAGAMAAVLFAQVDDRPPQTGRSWILLRLGLVAAVVILASLLRQWRLAAG